jgi:hypothetical protein
MGIYSRGWINLSTGAKSAILGDAARLQSKGDISTALDGVDQLCHKSPALSRNGTAISESAFLGDATE